MLAILLFAPTKEAWRYAVDVVKQLCPPDGHVGTAAAGADGGYPPTFWNIAWRGAALLLSS
jgi:hypothetical protein